MLLRKWFPVFLMTVVFACPAAGEDRGPLDALRGPVEEILSILKDPRYQSEAQKETQKEKLWDISRAIFDFGAIAERAVGRNWKTFSAEQKKGFIDAFTDLLGNSYFDKVRGAMNTHPTVEFLSQEILSDTKARVKTRIVRDVDAFPVDYSMQRERDSWTIYDVNIEGVSLVQNYRSQFNQILMKESPDQLIARIRAKSRAPEK